MLSRSDRSTIPRSPSSRIVIITSAALRLQMPSWAGFAPGAAGDELLRLHVVPCTRTRLAGRPRLTTHQRDQKSYAGSASRIFVNIAISPCEACIDSSPVLPNKWRFG
jgi:hypothetical protein